MNLYNTLTREKQELKPVKRGKIGFYSCGPTVYNYAHIGNFRTYIFTDVVRRSLEYAKYKVKHVMNVTDVGHLTSDSDEGEDKIEKGAEREGKSVWEIARFYEKAFFSDLQELNIKKPNKIVRATDAIKDQIKLIKKIERLGYAYETDSALYFDVRKFKDYGKLSGQSLEEKCSRAREEVVQDSQKRCPADFALWIRRRGEHKNHVMHWDSPWGDGFPGWHIECSAISSRHLGQPFDIHSGGEDHIGTHHENEIAQSEAAEGLPLANIWVHARHLILERGKMAKSEGNFITLQELKNKGFDPLFFRYLCLTAHYRTPLKFSWESLTGARNAFNNLICAVSDIIQQDKSKPRNLHPRFLGIPVVSPLPENKKNKEKTALYKQNFEQSILDDIDTPAALAVMWNMIKDKEVFPKDKLKMVKKFDKVFGLDILRRAKNKIRKQNEIPRNIKKLAEEREELRKKGEFEKADNIRLMLAEKGYKIQDKDNGSIIIHNVKK